MIQIAYKHVRTGFFSQAFDRLANNPNLPPKTSYNVSKIVQKLEKQLDEANVEFMKLVALYAAKDENGEIKPDPKRGPNSFSIVEGKDEEYKAAIEKFDAQVMTVDRPKILVSELETVKLAPNEYLGLEPILQESAEVHALPTKQAGAPAKPSA